MAQLAKGDLSPKKMLLIAFLEGFAVLGVEILGGKILSSYFGSSYIMWTVVLGITMFSLAIGYYLGGIISQKKDLSGILFNIMLAGGVLIGLMIVLSNGIFAFFSESEIYRSLIISSLLLIAPPLICIGSITSILIQIMNLSSGKAGNSSGKIYGYSTLGGITATFLIGYFIIPSFGVSYPLFVISLIMIFFAFLFFYSKQKRNFAIGGLIVFVICFGLARQKLEKKKSKYFKITYESEGILGQLKVLDSKTPDKPFPTRRLLINGIPQTYIVNEPTAYSLWRYPHFISAYASMKPASSSVLLIGLGGGSVARELKTQKFNLDVVEIDERILPLAKKYFYYKTDNSEYIVDDARHYVKRTKKKYDIVIYDVLSGEAQPNHVFTMESMDELKKILNPGGFVIVNYPGIVNDSRDIAFKALYKTFETSGFNVHYWATNPEAFDDIVFIISLDHPDFSKIVREHLNECCQALPLITEFLKNPSSQQAAVTRENIEVLHDDKPVLDHLNGNAMLNWRKIMSKEVTNAELEEGISIFK
jgi:predicted membrane-bound spermidine synthase